MHSSFVARSKSAQPIWFVTAATFRKVIDKLAARDRAFVKAAAFEPGPGRHLLLPGGGVLFGLESSNGHRNEFLPGLLPGMLPNGTYRFANEPHDTRLASLAFALGSYRFTRYRKAKDKGVKLVLPEGVDGDDLTRIADGVTLARDLINTPANDMGPADLEAAAHNVAKQHGAKFRSIVGDQLLKQNFPLIHAVGRAADARRAPRLIELRWGRADNPKVTAEQVFDLVTSVARPDGSAPLSKPVTNLLRMVIENGRLVALPEIAAQYHALVTDRSGTSDAVVHSAFSIGPQQLQDVVVALERRFGRKLNASVVIDPELIGGIRVVVGDEVLDTSIKVRLEQMKAALTAA